MIEVGGGHKAPAMALRDAIDKLYPGSFEVEVLDFMKATGNHRLDTLHKAGWQWMLEHPGTTLTLQRVMDQAIPVRFTRWLQARLLSRHIARAAEFVGERGYNILVATHFMPLQALALGKRHLHISAPLIGVNSDLFDGHALWAERHATELIVSSRESLELLLAKGVPREKLKLFGYPVGLQFLETKETQAAAREHLGLARDKLTVLHSCGMEGVGGRLKEFIGAVLTADLDIQYLIITGRNQRLFVELQNLAAAYRGRTRLLLCSNVDNMARWIKASDMVLGKAGAASTYEALYLGRPVFHISYAALNEKRNVDYCTRQGVGAYLSEPGTLVCQLRRFLDHPELLVDAKRRVRELQLHPGTLDIANHIVQKVG